MKTATRFLLLLLLLGLSVHVHAQDDPAFSVNIWANCGIVAVDASTELEFDTQLELRLFSVDDVLHFPFALGNHSTWGLEVDENLGEVITWEIRTADTTLLEGEITHACVETPLGESPISITSTCEVINLSFSEPQSEQWLFFGLYGASDFTLTQSGQINQAVFPYHYFNPDEVMVWGIFTSSGFFEGTYVPECDEEPNSNFTLPIEQETTVVTNTAIPLDSEFLGWIVDIPEKSIFAFGTECGENEVLLSINFVLGNTSQAEFSGLDDFELVPLDTIETAGYATTIKLLQAEGKQPIAVSIQHQSELGVFDSYHAFPNYQGFNGKYSVELEPAITYQVIFPVGLDEVAIGTVTPSCPVE